MAEQFLYLGKPGFSKPNAQGEYSYKIGRTNDPDQRLVHYREANPHFEYVFVGPSGSGLLELDIKHRWTSRRVRSENSEWLWLNEYDVATIIGACEEFKVLSRDFWDSLDIARKSLWSMVPEDFFIPEPEEAVKRAIYAVLHNFKDVHLGRGKRSKNE